MMEGNVIIDNAYIHLSIVTHIIILIEQEILANII